MTAKTLKFKKQKKWIFSKLKSTSKTADLSSLQAKAQKSFPTQKQKRGRTIAGPDEPVDFSFDSIWEAHNCVTCIHNFLYPPLFQTSFGCTPLSLIQSNLFFNPKIGENLKKLSIFSFLKLQEQIRIVGLNLKCHPCKIMLLICSLRIVPCIRRFHICPWC